MKKRQLGWCFLFLWLTQATLAATQPNIILITLDTFRADRMGFLGSRRGLTPNLDRLAAQSAVFTRAYAQVPLTAPSHATILTGTYPQFNQVTDFQVPLSPDLPYAPAIFHAHGYRTAAFIGSIVLDPSAQFAPGFDRGFDTYDAGFSQWHSGDDRYSTTERRGTEVVAHALAWLKLHPKGPFFVWAHLYDAHHPYDPPEPYKTKYKDAPYDGEIAYADSCVGEFLRQLRVRGLYNGSIIAVMADHGEALGDHGEDTHGIFLYDETIHVPLMIKLPGATTPAKSSDGKRIETRASLVDVLPTILEAAKIPIPKEVQGESLLNLIKTDSTSHSVSADRLAYAENTYPQRAYGWSPLRSLRTGKYLYVDAPRKELYDQADDPTAEHNVSSSSAAITSTLADQLETFRQKTITTHEAPKISDDPEAQRKLAALGYVASNSNPANSASATTGADPKDKIEIANLTNQTNFLIEDEQFQEAIPRLQKLIALDPDVALHYVQLGKSLIMTRDFPEAVKQLRKIVAARPDITISHFQLGMALLATEDPASAASELEIVVSRIPNWQQAHFLLANAYAETAHYEQAAKQCEAVLAHDPNNFPAILLLGRVLVLSGDAKHALPHLKQAAEMQPDAPEPHQLLSQAYDRLGMKSDAAREQEEAKRLGAEQ